MRNNLVHDCREELRGLDLRATPARLAVLNFLEKINRPVDVWDITQELQKQNIDTDPATAFRIVKVFAKKGIVKKIQFLERKFRYELTSKNDHHHLICRTCDSVQDIEDRFMVDWEKEIMGKKGFKVINHNLEFFGICSDCQD